MRCDECKFFEFKHVHKRLKWTGEFTWGICHKVPEQPNTFRNSWCDFYDPLPQKEDKPTGE